MRLNRICAIVPTFNHWRAIRGVIDRLRHAGIPVYVVDDGSQGFAKVEISKISDPDNGVFLHRFNDNRGKGAAVIQGIRWAIEHGYTHALQVDADGQHDLQIVDDALALSERYPDAAITGKAVYDKSVPLGRALGRWITHFWVWVETLSFQIPDTMCGFRIYPLDAVARLLVEGVQFGSRMEFDTEIAVRLYWIGTPILSIPVGVTYPSDNTSNFRLLQDNVRISAMHTRMVFLMLFHLPTILSHRPRRLEGTQRWPWLAERGIYLGLMFLAFAYRALGRRGCYALMSPVVFYFFLSGREQRRASFDFLRHVFAMRKSAASPSFWDGYRHFLSFAGKALDTFAGWSGSISKDAIDLGTSGDLVEAESGSRGALFIVSHIGNAEISRALLDDKMRRRLTIMVHTRHAENYNRLLSKICPDFALDTFQVSDLGPETAVVLQERIEQGKWVVIAGDRTAIGGHQRTSLAEFLGRPAPFSHGPFILAAVLDCPVYTLFCMREGERYRLDIRKFADRIDLPRGARKAALDRYTAEYARILERYALEDPYQWYNFFDFWSGYGE
jgi:predicted LPLAT superfamily acyltransferase